MDVFGMIFMELEVQQMAPNEQEGKFRRLQTLVKMLQGNIKEYEKYCQDEIEKTKAKIPEAEQEKKNMQRHVDRMHKDIKELTKDNIVLRSKVNGTDGVHHLNNKISIKVGLNQQTYNKFIDKQGVSRAWSSKDCGPRVAQMIEALPQFKPGKIQ